MEDLREGWPVGNIHFWKEPKVGGHGERRMVFENAINGCLEGFRGGFVGEGFQKAFAVMRNMEGIEKFTNHGAMGAEQPGLENFGGDVVVAHPGQFRPHPGMAFRLGLALEEDGAETPPVGQQLEAGAVSRLVLLVEVGEDFSDVLVGKLIKNFVGFHKIFWPDRKDETT